MSAASASPPASRASGYATEMPGYTKRFRLTKALRHQIVKDMVLPIRGPAVLLLGWALYNTYLFNESNRALDRDARFSTVRGRLLAINKQNYFYNAVPRYSVCYEFTVNGKRYESCRATTGSFFRDWMPRFVWTDTVTESQYLQAFPVLRVGEPCTVFYDRRAPQAHSALAVDANSTEGGIALYLAVFPLIFANMLRTSVVVAWRKVFPKKIRVRMPKYDLAHMKYEYEVQNGIITPEVAAAAAAAGAAGAAAAAAGAAAASSAGEQPPPPGPRA
jgi:hypothetical protein